MMSAELLAQAVKGASEPVKALILAGGYTSLGEASLPVHQLPKSQPGDIMIDHTSGALHASTGQDHLLLSDRLLRDLAICNEPVEPDASYDVVITTRAIDPLASALMGLFGDSEGGIMDRLQDREPFRMTGQAIHRLLAHALDTAGRLNRKVQYGQAPPTHAVPMRDLIVQIVPQPVGRPDPV